ncbi:hypothetical protein C8Q74DRAFT_1297764 [Fomes fomentarius]|nr:hypothetical protein C8Q74DRAFT_1297764 [Fomes fomentarius]
MMRHVVQLYHAPSSNRCPAPLLRSPTLDKRHRNPILLLPSPPRSDGDPRVPSFPPNLPCTFRLSSASTSPPPTHVDRGYVVGIRRPPTLRHIWDRLLSTRRQIDIREIMNVMLPACSDSSSTGSRKQIIIIDYKDDRY